MVDREISMHWLFHVQVDTLVLPGSKHINVKNAFCISGNFITDNSMRVV